MFEFIKKLFGTTKPTQFEVKPTQKYGLGAFEEEADNRDIMLATVQQPVKIPDEFETDLSMFPIFDQGMLGTCVAHAFALVKMYLDYIEDKKALVYSRRFLYALTRWYSKMDIINQGLYPRHAAKVMSTIGMIVEDPQDDNTLPHSVYVNEYKVTKEMNDAALKQRSGPFAFPLRDAFSFAQALYQNKVVPAIICIDWSKIDFDGTVHTPGQIAGLHCVVFSGRVIRNGKKYFTFRNSWGKYWGTQGFGYVAEEEIEHVLWDALVFTDVPNDIILRAKNMQYIFNTDLSIGSKGTAVKELQKRLISYGLLIGTADGVFGTATFNAVRDFQALKGIDILGRVGPTTRKVLNSETPTDKIKSKLDLWCEIATRIEGANPSNNNPGNIRCNTIIDKNAVGVTKSGFCIFPTYQKGYIAMRDMFVRCATLPDVAPYRSTMTLYEFYKVYAPAGDNNDPLRYASDVAKFIGCTIDTPIKELV